MRRELREVREKQEEAARGRTSFASNTESRAERVKALRANEDLTPSSDFDHTLQGLQVSWWPVGGSKTFPSPDCMEKTTCQNFVSEMLALFQKGKVKVIDGTGGKTVVVRSVPDPQAYQKRQVSNRGPDCLFYDGLDKTGNFAVTLEGEVKRGGKSKFSDDQIGQVTDGLQRLLDLQPERVNMIGFMTDGRRFQFFRIHRRHPGYHFDVSHVYLRQAGWQVRGVKIRLLMPI